MSSDTSASADGNSNSAAKGLTGNTLSTAFTVNDIQKSLAWYRDVVGFAIDQEYEREGKLQAVAMKAGAVRMLIGQDDGAKGWDRVKGQGSVVQITTSENVDEIANRIKAAGGQLETEPMDTPWGSRQFALLDPDGFKLVISTER